MKQQLYKTKPEIINWLESMGIKNYKLIVDHDYGFVVNVNEDVVLENKNLTHIPIKFSIVKGYFDCSYNKLTSLIGAPIKVGGGFYCQNNKLTSLTGCPSEVGNHFSCHNNKLTSLIGISSQIKGSLGVNSNCITSLLYMPDNVGGVIYMQKNPHPSLKNLEESISYQELYSLHIIDKIKHEKKLLSDNIKVSPKVQDKKTATAIHKI